MNTFEKLQQLSIFLCYVCLFVWPPIPFSFVLVGLDFHWREFFSPLKGPFEQNSH